MASPADGRYCHFYAIEDLKTPAWLFASMRQDFSCQSYFAKPTRQGFLAESEVRQKSHLFGLPWRFAMFGLPMSSDFTCIITNDLPCRMKKSRMPLFRLRLKNHSSAGTWKGIMFGSVSDSTTIQFNGCICGAYFQNLLAPPGANVIVRRNAKLASIASESQQTFLLEEYEFASAMARTHAQAGFFIRFTQMVDLEHGTVQRCH
ncbi:uncharacterized protein PV06_02894 [Exophiala oligosperma]|uniref:Uncharacterized protein n=1 Tax=Exophiala oligosperma TaxID=215243 RepID=A0A0D2DNG7_9EURO|nr:uncharacterized protein PV06_02894 [Exophiala oligosperma]KIW44423.1 hypothetical protein PV06_02894 [Exophiala oligosperma]